MRMNIVFKSAVAFCLALAIGMLLLPKAPAPQVKQIASAKPADAPMQQISSPPVMRAAREASKQVPLPSRKVDREFKVVDGGLLNDNARMTHLVSKNYAEGIIHRTPY